MEHQGKKHQKRKTYIGNGVMLPETPGVCALIPS